MRGVCVLSCSALSDSVTLWTLAHPLQKEVFRQGYWRGLLFPPPENAHIASFKGDYCMYLTTLIKYKGKIFIFKIITIILDFTLELVVLLAAKLVLLGKQCFLY